MNEWAKLVDKYAIELKKYDLVCAYCGQTMNQHTANTECADNTGSTDHLYTEEEPFNHPKGRHWFGKARQASHFQSPNISRLSMENHNQRNQRAEDFIKKNLMHHDLIKRLSHALNRDTLYMDGVQCKEDVVNLLFENIDFQIVKPADLFSYVGLFDDRSNDHRDIINVLV